MIANMSGIYILYDGTPISADRLGAVVPQCCSHQDGSWPKPRCLSSLGAPQDILEGFNAIERTVEIMKQSPALRKSETG